jgi:predicted nucleic acid-binding Zn ribbon protein
MPTYNFINTETGEEFESFMRISEREEFLKANPHIQPVMTAPAIVSGVSSSTQNRVPDGFKEVLSKVAEAHRGSDFANKHLRKSIKEVKTEQVVKKHVERITGVKT